MREYISAHVRFYIPQRLGKVKLLTVEKLPRHMQDAFDCIRETLESHGMTEVLPLRTVFDTILARYSQVMSGFRFDERVMPSRTWWTLGGERRTSFTNLSCVDLNALCRWKKRLRKMERTARFQQRWDAFKNRISSVAQSFSLPDPFLWGPPQMKLWNEYTVYRIFDACEIARTAYKRATGDVLDVTDFLRVNITYVRWYQTKHNMLRYDFMAGEAAVTRATRYAHTRHIEGQEQFEIFQSAMQRIALDRGDAPDADVKPDALLDEPIREGFSDCPDSERYPTRIGKELE